MRIGLRSPVSDARPIEPWRCAEPHSAAIAETTEAELDKLYDIHLKGVFFLTQKLLPFIEDGDRAGPPDDIGPLIVSLLPDDNRRVNGQRIEVSGGVWSSKARKHP